jgi:hypothetical protein
LDKLFKNKKICNKIFLKEGNRGTEPKVQKMIMITENKCFMGTHQLMACSLL